MQGFNHLKFHIIMRSAIPVGRDLQPRNHGIAGRFDIKYDQILRTVCFYGERVRKSELNLLLMFSIMIVEV